MGLQDLHHPQGVVIEMRHSLSRSYPGFRRDRKLPVRHASYPSLLEDLALKDTGWFLTNRWFSTLRASERRVWAALGTVTRSLAERPRRATSSSIRGRMRLASAEVVALIGPGSASSSSWKDVRSFFASSTNGVSIQDMCAEPTATPRYPTSTRMSLAKCSTPA